MIISQKFFTEWISFIFCVSISSSLFFPPGFCSDLLRVTFAGERSKARDLPGAALLCLSFTPKDVSNQGASRVR